MPPLRATRQPLARWIPLAALLAAPLAPSYLAQGAEPPLALNQPRTAPMAVRVDLVLGGGRTAEAAKNESPVELTARLEYLQQQIEPGRAARRYTTALLDGAPALREDRRLVVTELTDAGPTTFAIDGPLRRAEADLLQLAADPLVLNRLLPTGVPAEGKQWTIDKQTAAQLVAIAEPTLGDLSAVMTDLTASHARFRFAGAVHGRADGAETRVDLRGVALIDLRENRITRLNLALQEERATGPATPALDAGMKLNLAIDKAGPEQALTSDELRRALAAESESELLIDPSKGWSLLASRDWFVVRQDQQTTTLRCVKKDRLTAIATLYELPTGKPCTLAQLESDVRRAHGDRMTRILASDQWTTSSGMQCLALGAEGTLADGAPAEWRHYHASAHGRAFALTVTLPVVAGQPVLPVGRQLIETLRLEQPAKAETALRAESPSRN